MQIIRSASYRIQYVTTATLKKTALGLTLLTLLTAGVLFNQNILQPSQSAQALTPPDSCFAFNAGTGTITNYYNREGNNPANPACPKAVDIPSTIGGVPVTRISNTGYPGAFTNKNLTSVTIPNSVTSIGNYAFYSNQLTNLTIPNSVTSIGTAAFYNNQLTNLTIPSSVTSIGEWAFSDNQLTSLTIPSSVTSIGNSAFSGNQLTNLTIPSSVTSISDSAFRNNQLTNLSIPSSVTSISDYAFRNNQLTNLTIPSSVTSIGNYAFSDNQLANLTIPSSVTSIGNSAFSSNQLTSLTIPNSVTSIGSYAFSDNQLANLTIPSSVTSIGDRAFRNNQLTSLTIPSSVTSIGNFAFSNNQLTNLTIPNSVTSIGSSAFQANAIREVTIPNSVTSIGEQAFAFQTPQGRAYDRFNLDDDPASVAIANQTVSEFFYTRLYTEDPTNPNNLQSAVVFHTTELDGDGNWNDPVVIGGHIVNPASAETHHVNQSNASLHEAQTFTGQLPNESYLHDYNVAQGPVIPMPADAWSPTTEEQTAAIQALSAYYRIGDTITITPPAIDGYITPATQNFVLGSSTNQFSYVYAATSTPDTANPGVTAADSNGNSNGTGDLAHTGLSIYLVAGLSVILLACAGVIWRRGFRASGRVSFR